ncbi:two-component system sensor histidine kinase NtrB [Salipaludibacillus daqingensis]|uniref:two-component system sensor histidine kinase NtrB n=1 Tax=Salipaludibacillus daqingensis TaxID=3041001 RepID=UPI002476C51B|nr:ATP-binding protein [Salipaludibacillus daqingensis]
MSNHNVQDERIESSDLNVDMVINALPFGVLIVDAYGNFKHINAKVSEIWGGDPANLKRSSIYEEYDGYHKGNGKKVKRDEWAVVKALDKAESTFGEVIDINRFDGKKTTILNSAIPLFDEMGRVNGAVLTISELVNENKLVQELDIHKRYLYNLVEEETKTLKAQNDQLKAEIIEKQELLIKSRRIDNLKLVGDMAVGLAHEIRNPLTTVKGFLQLFSQNKAFEQNSETIDLMLSELDYTEGVISDFLSLATDKRNELTHYQLNECIQSIKPMIMSQTSLDTKKVIIEMDSTIPKVFIDEREIRQLILNLSTNGLEAMNSNQSLTIKTTVLDDEVILIIKDEGNGIYEDIIEDLGRPFLTTKSDHQGLGLSICYSIAKRNHAKIDFKTGKNGTEFFVKFPIPVQN